MLTQFYDAIRHLSSSFIRGQWVKWPGRPAPQLLYWPWDIRLALSLRPVVWRLQVWFFFSLIWARSRRCGCLVTWFCYQMIAKPCNKTAAPSWPNPYLYRKSLFSVKFSHEFSVLIGNFHHCSKSMAECILFYDNDDDQICDVITYNCRTETPSPSLNLSRC